MGRDFGVYELMKTFRLFLYFVVGWMLATVSVLAFAGTVTIWNAWGSSDTSHWRLTYAEACSDEVVVYNQYSGATWKAVTSAVVNGSCKQTFDDGIQHGMWEPLSKNVTCADGETPDSTGQCKQPDCKPDPVTGKQPAGCSCKAGDEVWVNFEGCKPSCHNTGGANAPLNAGFDYSYSPGQASYCIQGCKAYPGPTYYTGKDGLRYGPMFADAGQTCDAAGSPSPNPDKPLKETDIKEPVCKGTDGVMTSSSGRVMCVPEGTPSTNKPVVQTTSKTENFSDGSQRRTDTTTTTDPGTNATDTRQTVTATGAGGGSTTGQAGTVGTSSSSSSSSTTGGGGSGTGGGGGECDPTLNFCGGPVAEGLYEKKDKTFSSVLNKFTADVKATPFGQAMEQTLNISAPSSGACPNLTAAIPYLNASIDLAPYICSPTAVEYLEFMGTVLKIVVGYVALTWVFL